MKHYQGNEFEILQGSGLEILVCHVRSRDLIPFREYQCISVSLKNTRSRDRTLDYLPSASNQTPVPFIIVANW